MSLGMFELSVFYQLERQLQPSVLYEEAIYLTAPISLQESN